MTTEQAKSLSETAISRLMEALEAGQSEALKTYLGVMSRFHRYSWGNILLIYSQRPDATHVVGFDAWLKMRRCVRKGEKGIVILAPMLGRKKSDGELTEDDETRLFGLRAVQEFAQVQGDPQDYTERLQQFVASQKIALEYDSKIAPAKGLPSGGKSTLPPDMPPAEHFASTAPRFQRAAASK
jgi:hypothetical protein